MRSRLREVKVGSSRGEPPRPGRAGGTPDPRRRSALRGDGQGSPARNGHGTRSRSRARLRENNGGSVVRADRRVMVEIALTSNDAILGVRGKDHPLATYRAYGVPTALATDDEGVARSEMTRGWVKAVQEQELTYRDLKGMARTSLEHAFVRGASIWANARTFVPVAQCEGSGGFTASSCAAFAQGNTRATLQRNLELSFIEFERRVRENPIR
ncbi:MAG TPA: hypothetical protein VFS20_24160 [Longimicrobium sp.]|nr:hypothetical protein [Longimicrobium sp.]